MNNRNIQWKNMVKMAQIELKPDIETGELISRVENEEQTHYIITLSFDKMLPYQRIDNIVSSIRNFLKQEEISDGNDKFRFNYKNDSINPIYIEEYLRTGIKILSKKNHEVESINNFAYYFEDNEFHFNTHSDYERTFVTKVWNEFIVPFFERCGINNCGISVMVDDSKPDLIKKKEIEMIAIENENLAKVREQDLKKKSDLQANTTQGTYNGFKNKNRIPVKLSEVPTDNMGVLEFKQINGTDRVEFDCVLIDKEFKKDIKSKKRPGTTFNLFIGTVTDFTDSVSIKKFYDEGNKEFFEKTIVPNIKLHITGQIVYDDFAKDVVVMCDAITANGMDNSRERFDGSVEKRVELHAHTKMSMLDSVLDVEEYVAQAKRFGHKALAVTDRENIHVFPEFFKAAKKAGLKPIGGVEVNYIDLDKIKIALTDENIDLDDATYVVFDIETTGFCIGFDDIIEIGAVKLRGGMIIDQYSTFLKPHKRISKYIEDLTEISNDMVYDAPSIEEELPKFKEFISDSILVAHNAPFDTGFIYAKMKDLGIFENVYPCIDTIQVARCVYAKEGLKRFNLGACAKFLKAELEQQHRAIHDARTTSNVFQRMLSDFKGKGITNYKDLNTLIDEDAWKQQIPTHLNVLMKNLEGKKNLFKLVSDSQTIHFCKGAKVTSETLAKYRENLLVGAGCYNSDVFKAAYEKTEDDLRRVIKKYDYIEVQPPKCYTHLFEHTNDSGAYEYLLETIKKIVRVATDEGKIVVATGDVHELIKEDGELRKILLSVKRPGGGGAHELHGYKDELDTHFYSTTEMLEAFNFLEPADAIEIVINNTNKIADMIEEFDLFPSQLFAPRDDYFAEKELHIPSMEKALIDLCNKTVHEQYGEVLPLYVKERMDKELNAIIKNKFSSVYYISKILIQNSVNHGFIVGSRGSVGSSFVANLMSITEVNPLHPHYRCPNCHFFAFKWLTKEEQEKYPQPNIPEDIMADLDSVDNGFDLPARKCPNCGTPLVRNGVTCDFEVFLGFKGDKTPDIDLNFASAFKDEAHLYCQSIFGVNNAFRAGTILTAEKKTTYAYARDYYQEQNITKRRSELERLATVLVGSKRSTGQHPGGVVVVPDDIEVYDVVPIQLPPISDKEDYTTVDLCTTHFDYHTFESNLLKLDMLGHDDPLILRKIFDNMNEHRSDVYFETVDDIPFIDNDVLSIFNSKEALHIEGDDLDNHLSGTIGVPEFGTNFIRQMLETAQPKTFYDLIKISGLSHGTNVWAGNAEELIKHSIPEFPVIPFKDVIGCRDDILTYLVRFDIENAVAFKIMEQVRKGKHLTPDNITMLKEHNVPEWFIWTCQKIEYLFPKAHATAYVTSALRIAWFKVHAPIYYYAAYFTVRAKELEAEVFANGKNAIRNAINELNAKKDNGTASEKEKNLLDELYIALEMVLRGYSFRQIDINKSMGDEFVIADDMTSLYLPFSAIPGLGDSVANSVVQARNERPFVSKKDVQMRTKLNKTHYAKLDALGVFDSLPEDDPFTLFS